MHVLLTGYEPFGGEPVNPSAQLVQELAAATDGGPLAIAAAVLPVDRTRFRAALAAALERQAPELIVSVGQATGRGSVDLESLARNALDFRGERDNAGNTAAGEPLEEGGPERLHVALPLGALAARLVARGLPVRVSLDAGRHLCNGLLYELLRRHAGVPALFVHVPLLPEQAARRAQGEASLPLAVSRDCVAALLEELAPLAASRRAPAGGPRRAPP